MTIFLYSSTAKKNSPERHFFSSSTWHETEKSSFWFKAPCDQKQHCETLESKEDHNNDCVRDEIRERCIIHVNETKGMHFDILSYNVSTEKTGALQRRKVEGLKRPSELIIEKKFEKVFSITKRLGKL